MNRGTLLAILFSFLSIGACQETFRILTSSNNDIAENEATLIPMAVVLTLLIIFLAIRFWLKSSNPPKQK